MVSQDIDIKLDVVTKLGNARIFKQRTNPINDQFLFQDRRIGRSFDRDVYPVTRTGRKTYSRHCNHRSHQSISFGINRNPLGLPKLLKARIKLL